MDEWWCQWIVILWILSSTTAKCPSGQYYEPHKGCVSCDFICLSVSSYDQCRELCYNGDDNYENTAVETTGGEEASSTGFRVSPTALVITLICVLVLLGTGGGFLLYKYTKFNRRVDYNIAPEDQYDANGGDIEMQPMYNHAGELQNGESDEETGAEITPLNTNIQQQEPNTSQDTELMSVSTSTLPNDLSSPSQILDYEADTDRTDPNTAAALNEESARYTSNSIGVTDLRTQNRNIPPSGSSNQTESDNNTQTNYGSTASQFVDHDTCRISELSASESERNQCRQCARQSINQANSRSCFATSPDFNSNEDMTHHDSVNNYPHDPGATSIKSPVSSASPECDQFSVEEAIDISEYSQEATTEDNSQPAPNSPHSLRAFRPLLATNNGYTPLPSSNDNNHILVNEFFETVVPRNIAIMPVGVPHPVNGISSDELSIQDSESNEDSTTSDDSASTESDDLR